MVGYITATRALVVDTCMDIGLVAFGMFILTFILGIMAMDMVTITIIGVGEAIMVEAIEGNGNRF
jgi:hypothetical protein